MWMSHTILCLSTLPAQVRPGQRARRVPLRLRPRWRQQAPAAALHGGVCCLHSACALQACLFYATSPRGGLPLFAKLELTPCALHLQVATLLLAPICPHTCEHIWGNLLKKEGMVIKGG